MPIPRELHCPVPVSSRLRGRRRKVCPAERQCPPPWCTDVTRQGAKPSKVRGNATSPGGSQCSGWPPFPFPWSRGGESQPLITLERRNNHCHRSTFQDPNRKGFQCCSLRSITQWLQAESSETGHSEAPWGPEGRELVQNGVLITEYNVQRQRLPPCHQTIKLTLSPLSYWIHYLNLPALFVTIGKPVKVRYHHLPSSVALPSVWAPFFVNITRVIAQSFPVLLFQAGSLQPLPQGSWTRMCRKGKFYCFISLQQLRSWCSSRYSQLVFTLALKGFGLGPKLVSSFSIILEVFTPSQPLSGDEPADGISSQL